MYYPIIDKLKEVMSDLTSVKEKEPLIIKGIVTSTNGGTWQGTLSDIISAFSNDIPVFFKIVIPNNNILIPIFECSNNIATSVCFLFNFGGTKSITVGNLLPNNVFNLETFS